MGPNLMRRWLFTLTFILVACTATVTSPTIEVTVSTSTAGASPEIQATSTPIAAPRDLPDGFEQIAGVDDLPLVQDGPGLWRLYDEEAQVVCYLYGANYNQVTGGQANGWNWSGLSCLPAHETELGK